MSYQSALAATPTPDLFSLNNRTVIISGGGRGLGLSTVIGCLESGACVAAIDILPTPTEPDWSTAKAIADKKNLKLSYHVLDVRKADAVATTISEIFAAAPSDSPVRGMFLAAGLPSSSTVLEANQELWRNVFDVNVTGLFLCVQSFVREWLARNPDTDSTPGSAGASIVLTASVVAQSANRQIPCSTYSCSKAAVVHMARAFSVEFGAKGVRINSLSPGYIKTKMTQGIIDQRPGYEEDMVNSTVLKRGSTGDEYRGPVAFLLSDASSFVTGTDLVVDGGHAA